MPDKQNFRSWNMLETSAFLLVNRENPRFWAEPSEPSLTEANPGWKFFWRESKKLKFHDFYVRVINTSDILNLEAIGRKDQYLGKLLSRTRSKFLSKCHNGAANNISIQNFYYGSHAESFLIIPAFFSELKKREKRQSHWLNISWENNFPVVVQIFFLHSLPSDYFCYFKLIFTVKTPN